MASFSWINWSEVGREETIKREIFERFIRIGTLTEEDQKFCDKIDWYPVDEMELKEEFVKELKEARKKHSGKGMTAKEFDKWCNEL